MYPRPGSNKFVLLSPFITSSQPPAMKLGIFRCDIKMILNSRTRYNYILEFEHLADDKMESWTSYDHIFSF